MRRGSLTVLRLAFSMDGDGTPDALQGSQPGVSESPGRVAGDPDAVLGGGVVLCQERRKRPQRFEQFAAEWFAAAVSDSSPRGT